MTLSTAKACGSGTAEERFLSKVALFLYQLQRLVLFCKVLSGLERRLRPASALVNDPLRTECKLALPVQVCFKTPPSSATKFPKNFIYL